MMKKMDLAGVRIDDYNIREAMRKVEIYLNNESMNTVETITMNTIVAAGEDEEVRQCLEKMDLVIAGEKEILELAGVVSSQRIREVEDREFFYEFMKRAVRNHQTFFLLSQTEEEIRELDAFLQDLYDNRVQICGQYAFEDCLGDEADIVNEINGVSPRIILSTLPTPEQEHFLHRHQGMFNAKIWYGISAEYDVTESRRGLKAWLKKLQCRFKVRQRVQSYENPEEED